MENTAKIVAVVTASLFYMSALRLTFFGFKFGIPILALVNFSNITGYIIDVVYGLKWLIVPICLWILFGEWMWKELSSIENIQWFLLGGSVLLVVLTWCLWSSQNNRGNSGVMLFDIITLIAILCAATFAMIQLKSNRLEQIAAIGLFVFITSHMKFLAAKEMDDLVRVKIYKKYELVFKDKSRSDFQGSNSVFVLAITSDFVFIYDEIRNAVMTHPISEISEIKMINL